MACSLYQATAANFTQTLTAVAGFLEKGAKHFAEHGIDPAAVVETRVAPDMLLGRDVVFRLGSREMPFVAEEFLMSFSLPNFHFHASTAYGILRAKGVPIGKRYYLGRLRMKT